MDHSSDKDDSGTIDPSGEYPNGMFSSGAEKSCTDCRTTKTPLWRGGPSGPKSLCNACGIRYRKKRRELLGLKDGIMVAEKKQKKDKRRSNADADGNKMGLLRLLGLGTNDVLLKQTSLPRLKRRRRLAEEEEAAVLLMAISSGFLYA